MASEFTSTITDMDGVEELKNEAKKVNEDLKKIIDLDGNLQDTYDISDIIPKVKEANKGDKKDEV